MATEFADRLAPRYLGCVLGASPFATYTIQPLVQGVHGGPRLAYSDVVPQRLRSSANFRAVEATKPPLAEQASSPNAEEAEGTLG